ncbi:nitrous oxide reductase family maturation protein NosD [Burkholderia pseudomultivorans]|uniref:right-handed parallel beta-helix repeat-containing protein n=1 Tax=Burkholderia pseudomultivorans TaxID=1207504 RepID=UPI0038F674DD
MKAAGGGARIRRLAAACALAFGVGAAGGLPSTNAMAAAAASGAGAAASQPSVADAHVSPARDGADQADALQRALDALQPGQRLVFAPGRYVVGRSLVVRQPRVVLSGYGATLIATADEDQVIEMRGDGTTIAGFTLVGTGTTRLSTPEAAKLEVTGRDVQVLDNTIDGGSCSGIFVFGGTNVAIVGNEVRSTLADAIHITHGSRNVLVRGNVVRGVGDDMIAVVSYDNEPELTRNVLITGNVLEGNYWGRGITVVGGADVTIENNIVRNVQVSAGVLVAQEDSNHTAGSSGVLVEGNVIENIQTATDRTDPRPLTRQAAIDISTWSGTVTRVAVIGNRVSNARFGGIRLWGNVSAVRLADNRLSGIGGMPVQIGGARDCDGAACAKAAMQLSAADVVGVDATQLPRVRESLRQLRGTR